MFALRKDNKDLWQYVQSDETHEDPSTNVGREYRIFKYIYSTAFVYSDVNDHDSIVVRGILKREPNPIKSRGRKQLKYASIKIKSEPKREVDNDQVTNDMDVNIIELVDAEATAAVDSVASEETYANWATAAAETESATETVSAEDIIEFEPKEANEQNDQRSVYQMQSEEAQPEMDHLIARLVRQSIIYKLRLTHLFAVTMFIRTV